MIDSTARATRFESDSSPTPAYLWAPPEKPLAVSIPLAIVNRLEKEAVESFRSLSSRGSEIGGLLFGSFAPGSPVTVTIESYEAVDCDYTRGPLYRLAEADLERLDHAIEQRLAAGFKAIGFYRSHTRKGICLDADDLALLDSRFREPHHLALLVRPNATKASMAGIFFRENGRINGESSCLEFPFRFNQHEAPKRELYDGAVAGPRSVTASPAPAAAKPVVRAQIVPIASRREAAADAPPLAASLPAPVPAPETLEPPAPAAAASESKIAPEPKSAPVAAAAEVEPEPAPAKRSGKLMWILLGTAATLTLGAGLIFTTGVLRPKAPTAGMQDTSALALRVERNGADIVLTWNRDSEAIKSARRAVLAISDGPQQENVAMDLAQLRNGSIVYSPVTGDVVFKMEVTGADEMKTTSESVRVLRTRPSPTDDPNAQQAQQPPAAPAAGQKAETPTAPNAETPEPAPEEEKVKLAQAVKPFKSEPLAQRLRPGAELAEAPTIGGPAPAPANVNLGSLVGNATAPAPAPAPPPAPVVAPPVAQKKAAVGGNVQQAQLIKRRDPEYPRLARSSGAGGVVELLATIKVDGTVGDVKVLRGHPLLRQAAIDAVKVWVYRPAVLNGTPIETQSQVLLNFQGR